MWQSVRDDLCKGTMILPSSHRMTQWGRLHENHVEVGYISGQFSDGYGESLEQHPMTLDEDEVYISFWNSDDYYLKPESELFHDQKIEPTMGGLS